MIKIFYYYKIPNNANKLERHMTLDFLLHDENGNSYLPPVEKVAMLESATYSDREELLARANTAKLLHAFGDDIEVTEEDANKARTIFEAARPPTKSEKKLPGVLIQLDALVSEYDKEVIEDATRIRRYVTNKLLEETADLDPKIRMRAYELLGKVSEVGLFTERSEVTIQHKPTAELTELIRAKLQARLQGGSAYTAEELPVIDVDPQDIMNDLDKDM